jgi:preprotein translocase subunit Sec63
MRDRRIIFICVIATYLLYTIYEVDWDMQRKGDFYADLGLNFDAEDRAIQSRFRRLYEYAHCCCNAAANSNGRTLHVHPDKLKDPTPEELARAQAYYIHLKNARDTLVDSTKRFAYERFGPDMLEWKKCVTKLDFVKHGLQQLVPYYIITFCTLIVAGFLGYAEDARYVRFHSIVVKLDND